MNLSQVGQIGGKTKERLEEKGITTLEELITYYPINYQTYSSDKLIDGANVQISGTIIKSISEYKARPNLLISTYYISDAEYEYKVVCFNQSYLKFSFHVGDLVNVAGKYDAKKSQIVQKNIKKVNNIALDIIDDDIIKPTYSKINYISNVKLQQIILNGIELIEDPQYKLNLLKIHKPKDKKELEEGIRYLKYKEFYDYYIKLQKLKDKTLKSNEDYKKITSPKVYKEFLNNLPFELTIDQQKALNNIIKSLNSPQKTQTLVLGDVGSGKTIISIITSLLLIEKGYQVVVMAPTEILANQLYEVFKNFIKDYNIELLTSSIKKDRKRKIKDNVLVGFTKILIGTHAVIQEDVEFNNLALAIIDEQHRFGVEQRNKLIKKTMFGEFIYLSATPIPRTLAQSIFGVIDIEFIEQKPNNRKKIDTQIFDKKTKSKMFKILEKELEKGNQAFIVAPTIEETEIKGLENVEDIYKSINKYYKDYNVGLIHGQMKSTDKEKIMENFKEEKYNLLVATTVIEVGIDIKGATVIIVVNANRYGLAQLHQLRGRVGRSDKQSYCLLLDESGAEISKERLNLLKEYDDGFILAKQDLKIRKEGNFFGKEQSGTGMFKLFSYYEDYDIAQEVINNINHS